MGKRHKKRFVSLNDIRDLGYEWIDVDILQVLDTHTGIVYSGKPGTLHAELEGWVWDGSIDADNGAADDTSAVGVYTDPRTGGQKGCKREAYALIPSRPLAEVARVYGAGAKKYTPNNWRRGYPWSLSVSALQRHIEAWRRGNSLDGEDGLHHLAHAAFHLFALMEFEALDHGTDDRADVQEEP